MGKRGRPPKRKEITIKSDETKVFVGFMFIALTVLLIGCPYFNGEFFSRVSMVIGRSTFFLGLFTMGVSFRLLGYQNWFSEMQTLIGFLIIWVWSLPFLHFLIPQDACMEYAEMGEGGGSLGCNMHLVLYDWFDNVGEFIILFILFLLGVSVTASISLKKFAKLFEKIVNKFPEGIQTVGEGVVKAKKKLPVKEGKIMISGLKNNVVSDTSKSVEEKNKPADDLTQAEPGKDSESKKAEPGSDTFTSDLSFSDWNFPPISLLDPVPPKVDLSSSNEDIAKTIEETLQSFNIGAEVVDINSGPTVVQYSLKVSTGTKVAKISNLSKDIAMAIAAPSGKVRVQTPIPGTSFVGIEVPHEKPMLVALRELAGSDDLRNKKIQLPLIFGKSVTGQLVIRDLTRMPHVLLAGATGSGKSVLVNVFIMGLIMNLTPDELKLILIDPKTVEFAPYSDMPHLLTPVVTDIRKVVSTLTWGVEEMQLRYKKLRGKKVRNIKEYNQKLGYTAMPYIVIIIDEMADLMLSTGPEIENKIVRLAQMARAVGIHLILATQRPSVNVITGLIKANVPARIAMTVATSIDSRVVIDMVGAEDLLGNGDMLFKAPDVAHPVRIQGVYCSNDEIHNVVAYLRKQGEPVFNEDVFSADSGIGVVSTRDATVKSMLTDGVFTDAIKIIVSAQKGSASYLQRKLRIGYNRAARYIDQMEELGIVGPADGSRPREVLIVNADEFIQRLLNDQSK